MAPSYRIIKYNDVERDESLQTTDYFVSGRRDLSDP